MATDAKFFQSLVLVPGNNKCFECATSGPRWASVSFGVLLCLDCAGKHRGLGVHVSFVRSTTLDAWTEREREILNLGGNQRARAFFEKEGILEIREMKDRYTSEPAQRYKAMLAREVAAVCPESSSSAPVRGLGAGLGAPPGRSMASVSSSSVFSPSPSDVTEGSSEQSDIRRFRDASAISSEEIFPDHHHRRVSMDNSAAGCSHGVLEKVKEFGQAALTSAPVQWLSSTARSGFRQLWTFAKDLVSPE